MQKVKLYNRIDADLVEALRRYGFERNVTVASVLEELVRALVAGRIQLDMPEQPGARSHYRPRGDLPEFMSAPED